MKNKVYLIRSATNTGKTTLSKLLSNGKNCVYINNGLCEKIKLDDFKNFLNGKEDAIIFEEINESHVKRIKHFIEIFSKSINYSPIFIITTQILTLNFKEVDQYITITLEKV